MRGDRSTWRSLIRLLTLLGTLLAPPAIDCLADAAKGKAPYAETIETLDRWITAEARLKQLPALSIALVDDQRIVWAKGFGFADPAKKIPATADTPYRVGSVSKLFTDLAVMQLVEQGKLDLDAPIQRFLPDFAPANPFGDPVTLRQLMSHRAGIVREPPVGHYFDPTSPTIAATVRSLNTTSLVDKPGNRIKYSNAGVAVVGAALEKAANVPFAVAIHRTLLKPLGMMRSSFAPDAELAKQLALGTMWSYDGRAIDNPTFPLGTGPAGNLVSTVNDLGKFLSALFADGKGIVKPETLRSMFAPQFAKPGEAGGFGLGFAVGNLDGARTIGHAGSIYGFASELVALPDSKLGVVVIASRESANGITRRIGATALRMMAAAHDGKPLPKVEPSTPIAPERIRQLEGRYARGDESIDVHGQGGKLFLNPAFGGQRVEVRALGDALIVDDILVSGPPVSLKGDELILGKESYKKVPYSRPAPCPERWLGLIGEYGWDHDILTIHEKDGKLHALIEWYYDYPLKEEGPDRFRFPDSGMYGGESISCQRDASGRATEANVAGVVLARRRLDGEDGKTYKVTPVRPVEEVRAAIANDKPPAERGTFRKPELVDLESLDPTIRLDIRYATANNFLGVPLYTSARAFLQRPAAEALLRAHKRLAKEGYGLLIHDAYRPWNVTKLFWDATPESAHGFVADPARGSKHNRGSAVDLTLYDLKTGKPALMTGGYDEFSPRSAAFYPGGTALQRWQRDLLRRAMEAEGFNVVSAEWWHFDHRDWTNYPIIDLPFEEIR